MQMHLKSLPVAEAITSRHSIRRYTPDPVSREDLEVILRLASLAPSAWNVQPWRFHVVTEPEMQNRLQEAAYGQRQVSAAQVVILVASDMEDVMANIAEIPHPGMGRERQEQEVANLLQTFGTMGVEGRGQWGLGQTYIALGFLLVAAQGLGYGTVPMLGFDPVKVREILGLPEHVKFAAMVPIGVPAEEGYPHHRHELDRIVTYH